MVMVATMVRMQHWKSVIMVKAVAFTDTLRVPRIQILSLRMLLRFHFFTVGDHVDIIRGCGEMYHGAIVEGCFDLKGWAGTSTSGSMDGQMCFCDEDDCNKNTCDPTDCSCTYADKNSCNGATTVQMASIVLLLSIFCNFSQ